MLTPQGMQAGEGGHPQTTEAQEQPWNCLDTLGSTQFIVYAHLPYSTWHFLSLSLYEISELQENFQKGTINKKNPSREQTTLGDIQINIRY